MEFSSIKFSGQSSRSASTTVSVCFREQESVVTGWGRRAGATCTHEKDTTGPGKWTHPVLFITPKDEESKIRQGTVKLNNLIVQPRVCSHICLWLQDMAMFWGKKSQHGLHPTVLAANELSDELFQLFLIVPAGKRRRQM